MRMIEKNVLECLPETITTQFDFTGIYTDKDGHQHNLTVFDTSYFVMMLQQLHATRKILVNENTPSAHFISLFNAWKNSRKDLFLKQAYAYTLKYNPIENYSSVEHMIDDTTEHLKGASFKDEFHNTDTTETTPYDKVTQETTPYETKTETTPYDTKVETSRQFVVSLINHFLEFTLLRVARSDTHCQHDNKCSQKCFLKCYHNFNFTMIKVTNVDSIFDTSKFLIFFQSSTNPLCK